MAFPFEHESVGGFELCPEGPSVRLFPDRDGIARLLHRPWMSEMRQPADGHRSYYSSYSPPPPARRGPSWGAVVLVVAGLVAFAAVAYSAWTWLT
jgi:hypothetical protein